MLAFESAWRVLNAEHARIRELAQALQRDARGGRWRTDPTALADLQRRLQDLQALDNDRHRPKGVALVAALQGKSAEVDALLARLQADQALCDQWLAAAIGLAYRLRCGQQEAAAELARTLDDHGALLLAHIEREDTLLRDESAKCLAPEDWCRIVSSISTVVRSNGSGSGSGRALRTPR